MSTMGSDSDDAKSASSSPQSPQSTDPTSSKASDRLAQIQSHVTNSTSQPNSSKKRAARKKDELPADWSDLLGQIDTLHKIANTPDTSSRGYIRQKQAGKLWVRERIEALLDKGSFQEIGSVSGTVKWRKIGEGREEVVECTTLEALHGVAELTGHRCP